MPLVILTLALALCVSALAIWDHLDNNAVCATATLTAPGYLYGVYSQTTRVCYGSDPDDLAARGYTLQHMKFDPRNTVGFEQHCAVSFTEFVFLCLFLYPREWED